MNINDIVHFINTFLLLSNLIVAENKGQDVIKVVLRKKKVKIHKT